MWRAEDAWRRELARTTVAEIAEQVMSQAPPAALTKATAWITGALEGRGCTCHRTSTNTAGASARPALGPQQFRAILRGKCLGLRDERRSGGLVKLGGRLGPGGDGFADSEEEVLLPGR